MTITNVTTAGNNAPYPNAVLFGLSGVGFSQLFHNFGYTYEVVLAIRRCNDVASEQLIVQYLANTNPATGATVSGLLAGNYTAAVTDASGCINQLPRNNFKAILH